MSYTVYSKLHGKGMNFVSLSERAHLQPKANKIPFKKLPPLLLKPCLQQEREERKVVVVKEKTTCEMAALCH